MRAKLRSRLLLNTAYTYTSSEYLIILRRTMRFMIRASRCCAGRNIPRRHCCLIWAKLGREFGREFCGRRADSDFDGFGIDHAAGYVRAMLGMVRGASALTPYVNIENALDGGTTKWSDIRVADEFSGRGKISDWRRTGRRRRFDGRRRRGRDAHATAGRLPALPFQSQCLGSNGRLISTVAVELAEAHFHFLDRRRGRVAEDGIAADYFDVFETPPVGGDGDFQADGAADPTILQIRGVGRIDADDERAFGAGGVSDGERLHAFHAGAGTDVADGAFGFGDGGYDLGVGADGFGHQAFAGEDEGLIVPLLQLVVGLTEIVAQEGFVRRFSRVFRLPVRCARRRTCYFSSTDRGSRVRGRKWNPLLTPGLAMTFTSAGERAGREEDLVHPVAARNAFRYLHRVLLSTVGGLRNVGWS